VKGTEVSGPACVLGADGVVGTRAGRDGRAQRQEAQTLQTQFRLLGPDGLFPGGCAVVGEIKKQMHIHYHCTGYAATCQGNPASCRRKHVRERSWNSTSRRCSAACGSTTSPGLDPRGPPRQPCRRMPGTGSGPPAAGGGAQAARSTDPCHVHRQTGRIGGHRVLRDDVETVARGTGPLPPRHQCAEQSCLNDGVALLELARIAQFPSSGSNAGMHGENFACSTVCSRTAPGTSGRGRHLPSTL